MILLAQLVVAVGATLTVGLVPLSGRLNLKSHSAPMPGREFDEPLYFPRTVSGNCTSKARRDWMSKILRRIR